MISSLEGAVNENRIHTIEGAQERQQEGKGVATPLKMAEAAEFLGGYFRSHGKSDRLDVATLRGLCWLSHSRPGEAGEGFAAWDVAEAVRHVEKRHGAWLKSEWDGGEKETVADRVREQWNKIEKNWPQWEEGVLQKMSDEGKSLALRPERVVGGGAGKATRYRLSPWAAPKSTGGPVELPALEVDSSGAVQANSKTTARYICEEVVEPKWLARQFERAWGASRSWRHPMVWGMVALMLIEILLATLGLLYVSVAKSLVVVFQTFLAMAASGWMFWESFGPIFLACARRIAPAPPWLRYGDDDRLLEFRPGKGEDAGGMKLVRYAAPCPLCADGSKVRPTGGGWLYFGRLEGRCEAAPMEHRFRFDHKLRIGERIG